MKKFFAILDANYYLNGREQHLVIRNYAEEENIAIAFYGTEDYDTLDTLSFLKYKLLADNQYHGFMFFSTRQIVQKKQGIELLMRYIGKYEFGFACERLLLRCTRDIENNIVFLLKSHELKQEILMPRLQYLLDHRFADE